MPGPEAGVPPYSYGRLVAALDDGIPALAARQVTDDAHPDAGGFIGPEGLAGPSAVGSAAVFGYAYLLPGSAHRGSRGLVERLERAAAWGRRRRRASGRFDLLITNFDSAPDTGFTVQLLSPLVRAARQAGAEGDAGAARIAEALGELILSAAPGMAAGGFHTPNHRWVLVSALSMAVELYPELEARVGPAIAAYLAETIDINADGEYIERSTAVYNPVCNRSLRLAAEALDRPDLLAPVRSNLELSYHLMHGDGTVVTSLSSRQDRGERAVPNGLADSYYYLARRDGDARFAAIADLLVARAGPVTPWCLEPYLTHPEWRDPEPPRSAPETSYRRFYPAAGLWRVRRGATSATLAAGLNAPFSLCCGGAQLAAVRLSSTYFATGQFVGEGLQPLDGEAGARLVHPGRNPLYCERAYDGPVYWLPIGDGTKVDAGNWVEVRGRRATYELPPMAIELEAREVGDGGAFDLRVRTAGGLDGVPFQIELVFAPGGTVEVEGALFEARPGATMFLKRGHATYRVGGDEIRVGPGACAHAMWQMHNAPKAPEQFRMLITFLTPVDHALQVRTGHCHTA